VTASLGLSPGKIYFNLNPNEEECQTITLSSKDYSGRINIRDMWAEKADEINNLKMYTSSASDKEINIGYPNINDFNNEEGINVCLSGNQIGRYKGALIFTPEAKGNVVVEVGAWLFVNITEPEPPQETPPQNTDSNQNTGGNNQGGSGGSSMTTSEEQTQKPQTNNLPPLKQTNPETGSEQEEYQGTITGGVIGTIKQNTKIIFAVLAVVAIAGLLIYNKRRKNI